MKILNSKLLLATLPMLTSIPISKVNNINYSIKDTSAESKISLTTMFIDFNLDNTVNVGQETNLREIKNDQITDAINKEVLSEIKSKTGAEILQPVDFDTIISNSDNTPLSPKINLEKPITLKINIKAKNDSKILKDEISVSCIVRYPIFNFENFLKTGTLMVFRKNNPARFLDFKDIQNFTKNYTQSILELHNVGQPKLYENDLNFNYFGESVFENNDNITQTYMTSSITQTISSATEVSITVGVDIGAKASFSFLDSEISLDFKSQKTVVTKKDDTKSFTAPQMPVVVEPHHKTQVLVYLNSVVSSQKVTIDSDIDGTVNATINFNHSKSWNYSVKVSDIVKYYQQIGECPEALSLNSDGTVHLKNEAQISQYGTGTFWHAITNPIN